jgi:hypothetical protein
MQDLGQNSWPASSSLSTRGHVSSILNTTSYFAQERTVASVFTAMYTEARSLEYTTLSVSQNILFRYSLSMKNLGLIVYETLKK